jgi:hypothetical protein
MLNRLRKWLRPAPPPERAWLADQVWRGIALRLPRGTIVAELGLRHLSDRAGMRTVQALMDEAYVVVRTNDHTHWYATWLPYREGWDLLRLEDDFSPAQPAAPLPRARRAAQR